jgi:predicted short-subunit dehydrogenase-like oxidoreductase (DUF2520 family)
VRPPVRHGEDLRGAARDVDLLVLATPDGAVAEVARAVEPVPTTVVAHVAGSLTLEVLAPHPKRASLHPLRSIPEPTTALAGAWFAVSFNDDAGDDLVTRAVHDLGGRAIVVADEHRPAYHAAATIASNHLVALLGQVERIAAAAGLPLDAYLDLVRGTVDNVERLGPAAALTGPVRRGDWVTVEAHLAALPEAERALYAAAADAAARLLQ